MRRLQRFGRLLTLTGATLLAAAIPGATQAQAPVARVLYLSTAAGDVHPSRVRARDVVAYLGETSAAFTLTATEDVSTLNAATLAAYDALIFFTSGELPIDDAQKAAVLAFVASGKGFIGIHSAADTLHTWPEYGAMLGGSVARAPWVDVPAALDVGIRDRYHPATRLWAPTFVWRDELYEFRDLSSDNDVLIRLDARSAPDLGSRADGFYPVSWIRRHGDGHVFYTALGHEVAGWDDERFRQHVLGGIRWALGDGDADGMRDDWEIAYGLDPYSLPWEDEYTRDPDGDGRSNIQEQADGTHPRGIHVRYLAEGAFTDFFDMRLALLDVGQYDAHVELRLVQPNGAVVTHVETLKQGVRRTLTRADFPALPPSALSIAIESDVEVVVERTMWWGASGYGSHSATAVAASRTWFFAEGSTAERFSLFYVIHNPGNIATTATIAYLRPVPHAPVSRTYALAPHSRATIDVREQAPELASTDVATVITADQPIVAERAMYRSTDQQLLAAGHVSTGVPAPSTDWYFAEGATGGFFDLFFTLANPTVADTIVQLDFAGGGAGPLSLLVGLSAQRRRTIWIDALTDFTGTQWLDNRELSVSVHSAYGVPIVAERVMWWPSSASSEPFWTEAHASTGASMAGIDWAMAEGEVGGPRHAQTFLLIATTTLHYGQAAVRLCFEDGTTANRTVRLGGYSRTTIDVGALFPEAVDRRFSILVRTAEQFLERSPRVVVERVTYESADGVTWSAGSGTVGTRLH